MKNKLLLLLFLVLIPFMGEARNKKKTQAPEVKKETAYQKFFKGKKCETRKGLFTLHKMDGKVYFEIPLTLMERDMLLGSTVSEITDNQFANVGEKPFYPQHIRFTRSDSTVNLCLVNTDYVSEDPLLADRIRVSKKPAIMQRFPVKVTSDDSTTVVIDMTDFLLEDREQMNPFSPYAIALGKRWVEKEFKKANSFIGEIQAFEDNVSVRSSLTYVVSLRDQEYYYLYKIPFTAVMTRSFVLLPEISEAMRPRIADPRMNIFFQQKSEFSNQPRGMLPLFYANRWRVEPSDEVKYRNGELVEPKKPIVFYVDNAFPETWRKYIKAGIEEWNAAFEKIGLKNVVRAVDFPTDDPEFDPDNLKYSCVRYSPSWVANAMGPSWTDPRTGEIVNASVYVYHNMLQLVQNWRFLHTAQADADVRTVTLPEEIIGDCVRYVIAHEVGHCLGFMHNMASSAAIPVDSLRSPSFTQKYGTTHSIMDYARNNYVAQPGDKERGVKLTPPRLGVFDYFAIKWLYTPLLDATSSKEEVPTLDRWVSERSGDPVYRYGKQQLRGHIDPTSYEEDLGDDAMKAADYGIKNLKYILSNLNDWVGEEDRDYAFRKQIYNEILYQYMRYLNHVIANIGGIYLNERYEGDERLAYQAVERERQQRATRFILEQLNDMSWLDNEELLKGFELRGNISTNVEDAVFKGLMGRMRMIGICADKAGKDAYTRSDFLTDVANHVWKPTRQGRTLTNVEKKLQTRFLSHLVLTAGIANKTMSGGTLGITLEEGMIEIPECIKAQSRAFYGELPEEVMGVFTNRKNDYQAVREAIPAEQMGFGFNVYLTDVMEPMDHIYYEKLKQAQALIQGKVSTGSTDTRNHYKLLLYKINQALNN